MLIGTHNRTLEELNQFLTQNITKVCPSQEDHMFWLGDFNRHHPMWDKEQNSHLFTTATLDSVQKLLDLLSDFRMVQALLKDIPTLQSSSTGNWTRPDNIFCTDHSEEILVSCMTDLGQRGPKTDHVPVLMELDLTVPLAPNTEMHNYREVDWEEFKDYLNEALACLPPPAPLVSEEDFQHTAKNIDLALRDTIEKHVPKTKLCPHMWRWWTKELTDLRKHANQLSHLSHKFRALPDHICHRVSKDTCNRLANEIFKTKKEHWQEWLEDTTGDDIWTAHHYIKTPPGNGSLRTRVPTLKGKDRDGLDIVATTNEEKGDLLAQTLFLPPPDVLSVPADFTYPVPVDKWSPITREHLNKAIQNLSPYKVPGPDRIANIVFKCCSSLADHLLPLFNAVFMLKTYYEPWRESIMVILCKPGKSDYSIPKVYRPIALLNTTTKLLLVIVTDRTSYLLEAHSLLLNTHFSGRPGCSTMDSLHLLETMIKHAWCQGKVASALFLNIEGAFPNAVTDRLIHNMKTQCLPKAIVSFTEHMLWDQKMKLKFNNYVLDWVPITNGIGQGDPLSMLLYIIYSSDLVDMAKGKNKLTLAFVDDTAFIAIGKTFQETHTILTKMLEHKGGGYQWSLDHNSRFEPSKFALIDFSLNRSKDHPPLQTRNTTINPVPSHKFLGVILDHEL